MSWTLVIFLPQSTRPQPSPPLPQELDRLARFSQELFNKMLAEQSTLAIVLQCPHDTTGASCWPSLWFPIQASWRPSSQSHPFVGHGGPLARENCSATVLGGVAGKSPNQLYLERALPGLWWLSCTCSRL